MIEVLQYKSNLNPPPQDAFQDILKQMGPLVPSDRSHLSSDIDFFSLTYLLGFIALVNFSFEIQPDSFGPYVI